VAIFARICYSRLYKLLYKKRAIHMALKAVAECEAYKLKRDI